jgi:hypothetical protein
MSEIQRTTATENWTGFAAAIGGEGMSGTAKPQLCLYCKELSMAEALAEKRPHEAERFLKQPPEIIEFSDRTGAARFMVKKGKRIRGLVDVLLEGQGYGSPVVVKGLVAVEMPTKDRSYVLGQFGAPQGMQMGNAFIA